MSLHISALARALGAPLIERHGRGIRLTSAGLALARYAREIIDGLQTLRERVGTVDAGHAGSLALGASATTGGYILPAILSRFRARYPRVEIQLHVDIPEHLFRDLLADALDLVFSVGVRCPPGVAVSPTGEEELVIVVSPRHPLASRRRVSADELTRHGMVGSLSGSVFRELVEGRLRALGVRPTVVVQARHPEAMRKLVEHEMGYSMLFRSSVADAIDSGRLVAVRLAGPPIVGELIMAVRAGRTLPALARNFAEFVKDELARRPGRVRARSKTHGRRWT